MGLLSLLLILPKNVQIIDEVQDTIFGIGVVDYNHVGKKRAGLLFGGAWYHNVR